MKKLRDGGDLVKSVRLIEVLSFALLLISSTLVSICPGISTANPSNLNFPYVSISPNLDKTF